MGTQAQSDMDLQNLRINVDERSLKVNVNMATFNNRDITKTLASLRNQSTDYSYKINVYNNESASKDYTDNAKFKYLDCDILLTVDDDIIYPTDYIQTMVTNALKYGVVTCHGRILKDFYRYYQGQEFFHCIKKSSFKQIDILGTGVSCYVMSESVLKCLKTILNSDDKMMTDVIVSRAFRLADIPIYIIDKKAGWIQVLPNDDGCFHSMINKQDRLVELIQIWK